MLGEDDSSAVDADDECEVTREREVLFGNDSAGSK